ncbi:hypothetical protein DR950_12340 [Kitasatospora xanthocidica]|uniref:Uncharacterized protein n=1 Tax=Kitasatospora xanthocidica TaxID=83382 RepID=A0A372ZRI4_9ACTN|nr:DUF5959 family protein [Kitasatospora xanthocidica]RGD58463.1 hypothetical protein DR950_12340 [Kitasatospora xanthocidica]
MAEVAPMDLVVLADDEGNGVGVTVLGRHPRWSGGLAAEIAVATPFVSGRIDLVLSASKLEEWGLALDRLDAGQDIEWMEMDNGPSVFIQLTGERGCPEVVVEDESGSMVTVRVPIDLPEGSIADHRERLRNLLDSWSPIPSV